MARNEMREIRLMLRSLLMSGNYIQWVGGYVYGATSKNDDPFIILYPASEYLNEKVVRVYPHDFKKLPPFIPTENVVGKTDGNPAKDKAIKQGIYHECQPFEIVIYDGKETQMGREKRFGGVLYVPPQKQQPPPEPAQRPQPPNGAPQPSRPAPPPQEPAANAPQTQPEPPTEPSGYKPIPAEMPDEVEHWTIEALAATESLMFDTAILKLFPQFDNLENAKKSRESWFDEAWNEKHAPAYFAGIRKLVQAMEAGTDRALARKLAVAEFENNVNAIRQTA